MWLVIRDRVAIKDKLQGLEMVQEGNMLPIYNEGKDESKHVFVHCDWVYRLWARVTKLWNMNFIEVGDVITTLDVWFHTFPRC